jgi:hypothetical protein
MAAQPKQQGLTCGQARAQALGRTRGRPPAAAPPPRRPPPPASAGSRGCRRHCQWLRGGGEHGRAITHASGGGNPPAQPGTGQAGAATRPAVLLGGCQAQQLTSLGFRQRHVAGGQALGVGHRPLQLVGGLREGAARRVEQVANCRAGKREWQPCVVRDPQYQRKKSVGPPAAPTRRRCPPPPTLPPPTLRVASACALLSNTA